MHHYLWTTSQVVENIVEKAFDFNQNQKPNTSSASAAQKIYLIIHKAAP